MVLVLYITGAVRHSGCPPPLMRIMLQINELRKDYAIPSGGSKRVVDIQSFSLAAGRQVAVSGPSGCGKTTFLHLIAGLHPADGGSIRIGGEDMTALGESGRDSLRARRIGIIFQTCNLLQGCTALENVRLGSAFGRKAERDEAAILLARVGLGGELHHFPRQLSLGQQQRVAVARSLAGSPGLVLADEPTASLDPETAGVTISLIQELCASSSASLLLVSHDPKVLSRFETCCTFSELSARVHRGVA